MRSIDDRISRVPAYFWNKSQIVDEGQPLNLDQVLADFNSYVENFTKRGSGYVLERVRRLVICIVQYKPLVGGSSYIPNPEWLRKKKCVVNVINDDEKCFQWSILSALHEPKFHKERLGHYLRYENELNFDGITFPVQPNALSRFERQNPHISVTVLGYDAETKGFCIIYLTPHHGREHHIDLLLLDENGSSKRHYVWIRDLSRLIAHRSKHDGKSFVCTSCLHPFTSQTVLQSHIPYCSQHAPQQVVYPDPDDEKDRVLQFQAWDKQHKVPFYLVCDFESFLTPVERVEEELSFRLIDEHNVSGFCVYRVTEYTKYQTPPFVYSGIDPMIEFYDYVMRESRAISKIVTEQVDMQPLTLEQMTDFNNATSCGCCEGPFSPQNRKVKHHDHISGSYLFAACNSCNLQLKPKKFVKKAGEKRRLSDEFVLNVIFHNLKCYDAHFIIKHFERKYVEHRKNDDKVSYDDVKVIPQNSEKYLQFQIGNLRFLDSFQFLSTSLNELVSLLLKSGKHNFVHTSKHLDTQDDIVFSKGIYPYAYMVSRNKFADTQLPPIEAFYDNLKEKPLKQKHYMRAQQVWSRFGMTNMQQYHDHYLLTDVLLLADVFEHFRQSVMHSHKLDCLHFITLPSLAWAMALKHTNAKLDLITDPDAYLMLENSMRGGIATISKRYASANNQYVEGYNDSQPSRFITYLDANSLYATAQSQPLPIGNFRFLSEQQIRDFNLDIIKADAAIGYILECDVEYPTKLHDEHNDYPMAPDHLTVTREMLSPFSLDLFDPTRSWTPTQKLIPNLLDKQKYVVHYRNLQLYKKHGLVVTKIHRILSFTQSAWLKPWIDLCNEQRRTAGSEFESDLAKLQANATFGKTMEQVRNRVNIRLIVDPIRLMKAVSKVSYRQSEIINSDLVMVQAARTKVKLNKPIAVGFSILELSKVIMYKFYYEHLKAKYRDRCTLLFTDTDSLCCEIQTKDLYKDMGDHLDLYDTSNFSPDHPQYSKTNHRVLGKFKSETGSTSPSEFVGLRAKMYSLYVPENPKKCHKKGKGIKKHYVKNKLSHNQFVDVLRNVIPKTTATFRVFRSTNHVLNTVEMTKLCLCAFDDKRYMLQDGIHTLAYGHYSLRK